MAIDTSISGFTGFYEPPPQEQPVSTVDFLRGFLRGAQAGAASREVRKAKETLAATNQARAEAGELPIAREFPKQPSALGAILGAAVPPDVQQQQFGLQQAELAMRQQEAQQRAALASRQFAAQQAYQGAVSRDIDALGGPEAVDDTTATRIAARHFLRYGPAMGAGFGSALGSMLGTEQRATSAQNLADYREGQLKLGEDRIKFLQDKMQSLSEDREADRQLKRELQGEMLSLREKLATMEEAGREHRAEEDRDLREKLQSNLLKSRNEIASGQVSREQWLNRHLNQTVEDIGKSRAGAKLTSQERTAQALKLLGEAWDAEIGNRRTTPSGASPSRVRVKSPSGKIGTIPSDQLQDALKQGYSEVK